MTSSRPYRPALARADAIRELRATAGTQLDPAIVERFVGHLERAAQVLGVGPSPDARMSVAPAD
jgi:HD-GYP domain-containing protein (c-di-GMP phosphodiesterase class II)